MSAHSAGAYTATLLVMVNVMRGVGVNPPPSPARADFTLMTECTPESSGCYSVYSVHITMFINSTARHRLRGEGSEGRFSETKDDARELPENAQ